MLDRIVCASVDKDLSNAKRDYRGLIHRRWDFTNMLDAIRLQIESADRKIGIWGRFAFIIFLIPFLFTNNPKATSCNIREAIQVLPNTVLNVAIYHALEVQDYFSPLSLNMPGFRVHCRKNEKTFIRKCPWSIDSVCIMLCY
jgi:hypothetical protein